MELARVQRCLAQVASCLEERAARLPSSGEAAAVLEATALMASDPELLRLIEESLGRGEPTAHSVDRAFGGFCDSLAAAGGYLAERVTDLRDVRNRALAFLLGEPMPGIPEPGHPFVLVAEDLSPADTAMLDPSQVLALVTEVGGPTSHTVILARGLGIPAVVRCPDARDLADGTPVIVDGGGGTILAHPDEETMAQATSAAARRRQALAASSGPGHTRDGTPVALLVNVATLDEALHAASDSGCEGIGLFRTEGMYLGRQVAPCVAEQEKTYRRVFEAFGSRRVVVRTLDAGADKPLAFVCCPAEENPALGMRGSRVARRHPELLVDQLAALGRAAATTRARVEVMAPMVATAEEAAQFATLARANGLPVTGVMIEVPAAALRAERLMREVDFVSLGTNDLAQYTFAADRMCGELADLLDPWQPALLDLVAVVGAAGREVGAKVGVCGEAASDPLLACVLVGLGARSLSMAPSMVPAVRSLLAGHSLDQCLAMAEAAQAAGSAPAARAAALSLAEPELRSLL